MVSSPGNFPMKHILVIVLMTIACHATTEQNEFASLSNIERRVKKEDKSNQKTRFGSIFDFVQSDAALNAPAPSPSVSPSARPSISLVPTINPTPSPSHSPSVILSSPPSKEESATPSLSPSIVPTSKASTVPSNVLSGEPTMKESYSPSKLSSSSPSEKNSEVPSQLPSQLPSEITSSHPSSSQNPTASPSQNSTASPSAIPTIQSTTQPSSFPSQSPTTSTVPSSSPSKLNSAQPSEFPSIIPTLSPSNTPSTFPTVTPTFFPSKLHSDVPSSDPSDHPSSKPSLTTSEVPSSLSSLAPSTSPSTVPSNFPSVSLLPSSLPSVIPSAIPSIIPSSRPSSKPSINFSSLPSYSPSFGKPTWCEDSTEKFEVTFQSGVKEYRCSWVALNVSTRCERDEAIENCPDTCKSCRCKNNPSNFTTSKGAERDCAWYKSSTEPCDASAMYNCPQICGRCDIESPSETPSMIPTSTRPPVKVTSKIQLQIERDSDELMNINEQDLLEDTISALFVDKYTKPKFNYVQTKVESQTVRQIARRQLVRRSLQNAGEFIVFVTLFVSGEFAPIGASGASDSITTPEEAEVDEKLQMFFSNSTNVDTLIVALTNNTSSVGDYFRSVTSMEYTNADPSKVGNPINTADDVDNEPFWKENFLFVIVAPAAALCVVLFVAIACFLYSRRRRSSRLNEVEDEVDDSVAFATTTTSQLNYNNNNNNNNNQSWQDVQPVQPYSNIGVNQHMDDEATDGGGTFNTLEQIYSGESGDQMSYGYSLDDGIMSKQSQSLSFGQSISVGTTSNAAFDQQSVDISLGSPTDSVYSGLTYEDGSLMRKLGEYDDILPNRDDHDNNDDVLEATGESQYERVCIAPPGKLGVVIDTTKYGPVVYQVKDGSPLQGVVFPGDRIIGIDDTDTRQMSASGITKIMATKSDCERRITVSSKKFVE